MRLNQNPNPSQKSAIRFPRTRRSGWLILPLVIVVACTPVNAPTTTTTSTLPPAPTTTIEERCPDAFCVIYSIRSDASWSDGNPVVADDFAFTFELFLDPGGPDPAHPGYELITDFEVWDDETFMITFSEVFAPWRTLFEIVYPSHVAYDDTEPGPTNGPFRLSVWDENGVVLERNPEYSGPASGGDVEELSFVVREGVRDTLEGMGAGEVDFMFDTRPIDWMIDDLAGLEGIDHRLAPGPYWEHITFNHDDPLLSQSWAREAVSLALDLEAILDATVRTLDPSAAGLGNTIWMEDSIHYQSNFETEHDPPGAGTILAEHCELGDDNVQVCDGHRFSVVWATTLGDPHRQQQLDMAVEMLGAVGIEVLPWRLNPTDLFSAPILFGDASVWQMMSFSWKADADPFLGDSRYRCEGDGPHGMGGLNVNRFCDEEVDDLIASTGVTMDPEERADLYNRADARYLEELAVIPLYQRPSVLAWSSTLEGPVPNPFSTPLWNAGEWSGQSSVVVALDTEPISLTQPVATDDGAEMIMSALYAGAFSVDPTLGWVPMLVDDVEVIVRNDGG